MPAFSYLYVMSSIGQRAHYVRQVNMASMTVVTSVYGVRPATAAGDGSHPTSAPAVQPGTGHLVFAAANTGLQFYDVLRDRHVSLLQVCRQGHRMFWGGTIRDSVAFPLNPGFWAITWTP